MIKVRFAPSPTGPLHVGNARTALVNWLFAHSQGGHVLLRSDDTDQERSTRAFEEALLEDLTWLGFTWDSFVRQSERHALYQEAVETLKAQGRLYPCYETAEELALKRKSLLSQGRPPLYDRHALSLSPEERGTLSKTRSPHWRFKLSPSHLSWNDLVQGPTHFEAHNLSDPVLIREDGRPLYTLTSVVDDIDVSISHIIRGGDHMSNTAVQMDLFHALGASLPVCAHVPLLLDTEGRPLSKRLGSLTVARLREQGIEPGAVVAYMAQLGTLTPSSSLDRTQLKESFSLDAFGKSSPRFDPQAFSRLSGKILHTTPFHEAAPRLSSLGIQGPNAEKFWHVVQGNLSTFNEALTWWRLCYGPYEAPPPDTEFMRILARHLPTSWTPLAYTQWIKACQEASGRRGKAFFLPLRQSLTGRSDGPDLFSLLDLMGIPLVKSRLER